MICGASFLLGDFFPNLLKRVYYFFFLHRIKMFFFCKKKSIYCTGIKSNMASAIGENPPTYTRSEDIAQPSCVPDPV